MIVDLTANPDAVAKEVSGKCNKSAWFKQRTRVAQRAHKFQRSRLTET